jgi:versiconal hemiacetal acetate esterase
MLTFKISKLSEAIDANPEDSLMFTILSKNHAYFPPTYISTCGAGPLRNDGVIMIAALKKAGVATKYKNYPGMPLAFWTFPQLESSSKFLKDTVQGIRFVLDR